MVKQTSEYKKLISQCRYYKGEDVCPFGGDLQDYWSYSLLMNNPKSYWWHVEKEVLEMGWDDIKTGVECKIYKHMEYCPMSEEMCMKSYLSNA